ncbi:MAG: hypothetical protein COB90_03900 [Hyphomicrobiales bacterium]|nr:MAG: hypothetical protein COB90_03900 [Hyphomicrobiales bacterium]
MKARNDIEIIVLAAGLSRRMGHINKLLLPIGGQPLIRRTVETCLTCSTRIIVVLGHQLDPVRKVLDGLNVRFVVNPRYISGQKTSVRCGLDHAAGDGSAIMIGLADLPLLQPGDLAQLIQCFDDQAGEKIVQPWFGGQPGNPVLFPASLTLPKQDTGPGPFCRTFIKDNPDLVFRLQVDHPHFTTDLDTPEDYQTLTQSTKNLSDTILYESSIA